MKLSVAILLIASFLLFSCNTPSHFEKEFNCSSGNSNVLKNLEENQDVKKTFSIQLPKHWKINLFFDEKQSSVYAADTTKQLTETTLLDVTSIRQKYTFNKNFEKRLKINDANQGLTNTSSQPVQFLNKEAYYAISTGKKGKFSYKIFNLFINSDNNSFHIKTEVYGDSLVDQRFCKALTLIKSIKI